MLFIVLLIFGMSALQIMEANNDDRLTTKQAFQVCLDRGYTYQGRRRNQAACLDFNGETRLIPYKDKP